MMQRLTTTWRSRRYNMRFIPLSLIFLAGTALRLYNLDFGGLWLDEIAQASVSRSTLSDFFSGVANHIGATPLDYAVTQIMLSVSAHEAWLKLPAVTWGVASILVIYRLGTNLFGPTVGLLSSAYLAFAPMHIRYSQELRFYSLFVFLSLLSTLFLLRARRSHSTRHWLIYTFLLGLCLYSHYFSFFLLMFHALLIIPPSGHKRTGIFLYMKYHRAWFISATAAVLSFVPWIIFDIASFGVNPHVFTIQFPSYFEVLAHLPSAAVDTMRRPFQVNEISLLFFGTLFLVGLVSGIKGKHPSFFLFAGGLVFAMPFIVLIVAQATSYFYHPRQMIFVLPFFLLTCAFGAWIVSNIFSQQVLKSVFLLGLLLVALLIGTQNLRDYYTWEEEPWKRIAEFAYQNNFDQIPILVPRKMYSLAYYVPELHGQKEVEDSIDGLAGFLEANSQSVILVTVYMELLPEYQSMVDRIRSLPHLKFIFDHRFELYYIDQEKSQTGLYQIITDFYIPTPLLLRSRIVPNMLHHDLLDEARAILESRLDQSQTNLRPSDLEAAYFQLGLTHMAAGNGEAARSAFMRVISLNSQHEGAMINLGRLYVQQGSYSAAIQVLRAATDLAPKNAWSHYFLGRAHFGHKDFFRAMGAYQSAIALDDTNATFHLYLGQAQCRHGLKSEAMGSLLAAQSRAQDPQIAGLASTWTQHILLGGDCP